MKGFLQIYFVGSEKNKTRSINIFNSADNSTLYVSYKHITLRTKLHANAIINNKLYTLNYFATKSSYFINDFIINRSSATYAKITCKI